MNNIMKEKDKETTLETALENTLLSELNDSMTVLEPESIDVESFFSFLNMGGMNKELYRNIHMDKETAIRMKNHMISMKHGTYAAVPLICKGIEKCPIASHCWFAHKNKDGTYKEDNEYPMLQTCPVESSIIEIKIRQYIEEFKNSIDLTPTTLALLTKLAEIDIYEIRCDMVLSAGDTNDQGRNMLVQTVEAINEKTGDVIYGSKEHPMFNIKEKLQRQRDKILSQLVATPESKLKVNNNSQVASDLASKLTELNNILENHKAIDVTSVSKSRSKLGNPKLSYIYDHDYDNEPDLE